MPRADVLALLGEGTVPVLGICYGMNVLNQSIGGDGSVAPTTRSSVRPTSPSAVSIRCSPSAAARPVCG